MEFDLNDYCTRYTGYTLLVRLNYLQQYYEGSNPELANEISKVLHNYLKNSMNTSMYVNLYAGKKAFDDFRYDSAWVDETDRKANMKFEQLENELQSAKSSMIKESIRIALNDLGNFHLSRGNLVEAIKAFGRTRDFSSMPKHSDEYCINLVVTSILMDKISNIANYIGKIDDNETSLVVKDKLRIAKGLFYLHQASYEQCARSFLSIECSENIIHQFPEIISTHDIAIYTTLCSLATLNRNNIRRLLLENREFKSILDCVPLTRILLNEFLEGKYSSVIEKLTHFTNILSVDLYFNRHIERVIELIRQHLVVTYLTPFSSVHLQDMCHVFNLTQDEIEDILCYLISTSQLNGKIDVLTNTFQRTRVSARDNILENIQELSQKIFPHVVERSLFRLQLMKANIIITNPKDLSPFRSMGMVDEREDYMDLHNI